MSSSLAAVSSRPLNPLTYANDQPLPLILDPDIWRNPPSFACSLPQILGVTRCIASTCMCWRLGNSLWLQP